MSYDFIVEDSDETTASPVMSGWETVVFQVADVEEAEAGEDVAAGLEELLVERYFGSPSDF
jgi:hypothetical protein